MKPIRLNYRHSLKSMNAQLEKHDEFAFSSLCFDGLIYEVRSCPTAWSLDWCIGSALLMTLKKSDLADYINKKNGFN